MNSRCSSCPSAKSSLSATMATASKNSVKVSCENTDRCCCTLVRSIWSTTIILLLANAMRMCFSARNARSLGLPLPSPPPAGSGDDPPPLPDPGRAESPGVGLPPDLDDWPGIDTAPWPYAASDNPASRHISENSRSDMKLGSPGLLSCPLYSR